MGNMTRTRGRAGFSLLEVLVSLVIMSVGMLSLAQLQASLIRSSADAKSQTLAMGIAKRKIENLASVQSLGGNDAACVSPSEWVLGQTSCYRAVTDEPAEDVDGDPILAGIQPLGGVEFEVSTEVSRFVFDVSTSLFDTIDDDDALDSTFITSAPETFLPGKEFKRILVTVAWAEPDGSPRQVQVEDVLNGVVPRDSIALLTNRRGNAGRRAEAIINDPGTVPGVVPMAVGDESRSAASNPAPELLGGKNNSYVSETRFDVLTYVPLDSGAARAQSRVETAVVGCRCDTATASSIDASLRPSYWNGTEYVVPTIATYAPIAGPKTPVGQELPQSDQCRVCCRDHHDPPGDDANGDTKSAVALYSPRRSSHDHYLVDATSGLRTLANTGPYDEVCRMIRINGIFRVAADLHDDYFALLPARNAGVSAFAPSDEVAGDYGDMVKRYLDARIVSEDDSDRYNDSFNAPTSAGPDPTTFETGDRELADGTTRSYDLNLPADYFLKLSADSKWLHARGLYIDFLTPEAIARIDAAKIACPNQPATAECVLPYLPFTTINLSELAEWEDEAITPSGAASGVVLSVINNGFRTATGDESYVENDATGLAGSQTISFGTPISDSIVPGMTVAGAGLADGARVVTVANSSVTVDKPHAADIGATVTFEGAPVRGLALPGSATDTGYSAYARAIASYNNAAIALKFPMNPDEDALSDQQRIQISADGAPPDPTAGVFTVAGFTDASNEVYPFGTPYPVVEWGVGTLGGFSINTCTRQGAPLPYLCAPSSGLGGAMRIRISGYNVRVEKTEAFTGSCNPPGNGAPITVSGTTSRPYCRNYDITAASTPATAATTPFAVTNPGKGNESTEIGFAILNNNDPISIGIDANGDTAGSFVSCTATNKGALNSVTWNEPCL